MKWLTIAKAGISGYNDIMYTDTTYETCLQRCLDWDLGPCMSFDWTGMQSKCFLTASGDQHNAAGGANPMWTDYMYGELCDG